MWYANQESNTLSKRLFFLSQSYLENIKWGGKHTHKNEKQKLSSAFVVALALPLFQFELDCLLAQMILLALGELRKAKMEPKEEEKKRELATKGWPQAKMVSESQDFHSKMENIV